MSTCEWKVAQDPKSGMLYFLLLHNKFNLFYFRIYDQTISFRTNLLLQCENP